MTLGISVPVPVRRRDVPDGVPPIEGIHPVLSRVYAARGIRAAQDIDHGLPGLLPPDSLRDMDRAVAVVAGAMAQDQRILIVADFDADGATSCALLVRALRAMGARHVDFIVPNRFEMGYGLTPEIVALAAERDPNLIITVDNGISSVDGVRAAQARGIRVVITDHHLPGSELPSADAIVNPNQPGCPFPEKTVAGVGVAFYLAAALRAELKRRGWFGSRGMTCPNLAGLLGLVALGTVADVVPLERNNRVLVAEGLKRIRQGQAGPLIAALFQVAGRDARRAVAADLGFALGPRINAAGRLEDMSLGISGLLLDDPIEAKAVATRLDELNRERRTIEDEMRRDAEGIVDALGVADEGLPAGLCLFDVSWHQGVIGLVASRIRERTHRPVIALAPGSGGEIKGSARSVPGFHVRDALETIAARHPGLLLKFGGHAMAAGMTIEAERLSEFRAAFEAEAARHLDEASRQGEWVSDGALKPEEIGMALAVAIREAGPWGQGFPEPAFDGVFTVMERRVVGERHLKLKLKPEGGERIIDGIAFGQADVLSATATEVRALYRMDINLWNGVQSVQLVVEGLVPVGGHE